jgi:hypothetical protein
MKGKKVFILIWEDCNRIYAVLEDKEKAEKILKENIPMKMEEHEIE